MNCRVITETSHDLYQSMDLDFVTISQHLWFFKGPCPFKQHEVFFNCIGNLHGALWVINYIDIKAKCLHLKNLPTKGLCGMCLSVWDPLPSYDPITLPPLTHYTFILYTYSIFTQGRGEGELTREKDRGVVTHKAGSKIPTWLIVYPVYRLWYMYTCREVSLQVNFFRWWHFA